MTLEEYIAYATAPIECAIDGHPSASATRVLLARLKEASAQYPGPSRLVLTMRHIEGETVETFPLERSSGADAMIDRSLTAFCDTEEMAAFAGFTRATDVR